MQMSLLQGLLRRHSQHWRLKRKRTAGCVKGLQQVVVRALDSSIAAADLDLRALNVSILHKTTVQILGNVHRHSCNSEKTQGCVGQTHELLCGKYGH